MQLQDKYRTAVLSAYALALHGFEALLPSPIPWLRLGLANIIALTALMLFGFRTALMITLIRVVVGSLFTGTFLGPSFILSLGGGICGTCAMGAVLRMGRKLFGPVGISLVGALFHNAAQLFLAYWLFIQRIEAVLFISPVIILMGTCTGLVNGVITDILIKNLLNKEPDSLQNAARA
jgi:heptaprenyl diphosphate synthase